jgi:hypothetical protein
VEVYKNINGSSNVKGFELSDTCIIVWFKDGSKYRYSQLKAGIANVSQMKILAVSGCGLNSFINKNVKMQYDQKCK